MRGPQVLLALQDASVVVTPDTATLALTGLAPQVNLAVIPDTATLTLTSFAPQANLAVIPDVASLVLTPFAPVLGLAITPDTASLTLSSFAPQLGLGVVPDTAALSLTAFAPSVATPVLVTPGVASLVIGVFAPLATIAEPNNPNFLNHYRRGDVYPAIRGAVSEWAFDYYRQGQALNNLDQSFLAPVVATPVTASLILATFAPTVLAVADAEGPPRHGPRLGAATVTGTAGRRSRRRPVLVVPDVTHLRLTPYPPTVTLNDDELALLLLLEAA